MIKKIPYAGHYPSAAGALMREGICTKPRQIEKSFKWANGLDIIYTLKGLTPANFRRYSDILLLLAYQEAMRYNHIRWKFAGFDVRLGRLSKSKDLPEIATFQAAMHDEPNILVYGPDYEVPQRHFLYHKVEDILDITKRYSGRVSKQNPFKVLRLFISIREPI